MAHQCHSFILPYAALPLEPLLSPISAILMPAHFAELRQKRSRDTMPVQHPVPAFPSHRSVRGSECFECPAFAPEAAPPH